MATKGGHTYINKPVAFCLSTCHLLLPANIKKIILWSLNEVGLLGKILKMCWCKGELNS